MEIKVIEEKENKLIGRKELTIEITYDQKPLTRVEALTEIAKKIEAPEELMVLKKMSNVFGTRKTICGVNVYGDEATLKKFEPKHILERIKKAKEKAQPKEEKKEGEQ
ncbi:MAG: hypothetical protein J7K73_01985 [Nanoarchaeota archaeon]|nr:hypothetical protein [Nanoarchaeota archaeon]